MAEEERTPVIVGVGERVDRATCTAEAREPVDLMADALRAAEQDAGAELLGRLDSLELVGLASWSYRDPVDLLRRRLGVAPRRRVNAGMGGETPVRLLHEAALSIARGEIQAAAVVGGEAAHAAGRAAKAGETPPWTPPPPREEAVRFPSSSFPLSEVARTLGVRDPATIYPFYETATQAAWSLTPAEAAAQNAALWSRYAEAAAANPSAWIRSPPDAATIAEPSADNRRVSWPYTKLMVANPMVNQAAGFIVASLALARAAGVPQARMVHVWGGAHAVEAEDYLRRDTYARSAAQAATLARAVEIAGGDARRFDHLELYSCFPVVPKMALRELGLSAAERAPTVTGGLTFFGGPLNNYMSHAVAAMVRRLREAPGELGLLYGQGGYVNKHQTLVLSTAPPPAPLAGEASVQARADALRGPSPEVLDAYEGPATVEAYTVRFARDGEPVEGYVILRTPEGARTMARTPPGRTTLRLLAPDRTAVGLGGRVATDVFGKPAWRMDGDAPAASPVRRFCRVEREGPLTIVTLDRPEAMNALHPEANAELAEVFDAFARDPKQWVAIVTGAGDRAFSAGNDLKATARAASRGVRQETPRTGFAGLTSRFDLDKPVIAAVNGLAMGGGFEIALACDLIVASETAVFALPEPHVGLAALAGGLLRLPALIGEKRAMGMILTGRRVTAAEGLDLGFVNEVVPLEQLMPSARRWAAEILQASPMSIRASKAVVRLGREAPLPVAYAEQMRLPATRALLASQDLREGPLAFAQKRPPQWKGR